MEWFVEQLPIRIKNAYSEDIQKALDMEKEQMKECWEDGQQSFSSRTFEQYYNETFDKK